MMKLLDGKVVMVTGGARGQGRAHAVVSAKHGANVVLVDLVQQLETVPYALPTTEDLKQTVACVEELDGRAIAIEADVRDGAQMAGAVQRAIAEFGKIDAFIANAGIWTAAPFWELTDEQWDETISTNLTGVWQSVKAVAPHMMQRRAGSIVVTSSVNGLMPSPNYAHYIASKFGVRGLMQAMALELRPYGVRCNAILPGATKTGMINHQAMWDLIAGHPGAGPEVFDAMNQNPLSLDGRAMNEPEDLAHAALYLNSELASRVSGTSLVVDGAEMFGVAPPAQTQSSAE